MANTTSFRRKQRRSGSSSKRSGIAPWRQMNYKGALRLAFENAIKAADPDTLVRWTPLFLKVRSDGFLTTTTWSGPRDGVRA